MTTIAKRVTNQALTPDYSNIPLLLSEKQAAEFIGKSVSYLRKSRCEGTRKERTPAPLFVRVDGRIHYRRTDLFAWIDNLTAQQVI